MRILLFLFLFILTLSGQERKKILWIDYLGRTQVNDSLIRTLSEPEKAILAYYSVRAGSDCKIRNGQVFCKLSDALLLDQCSREHAKLILKYFEGEKEITEDIGKCYKRPKDAMIGQEFHKIELEPGEDEYRVHYLIKGFDFKQNLFWKIDGVGRFKMKDGDVELIKEEEILRYAK